MVFEPHFSLKIDKNQKFLFFSFLFSAAKHTQPNIFPKKKNMGFVNLTHRKIPNDRKVLARRSLVANRSEVSRQVVERLWRIVHQLHYQLLQPIHRLRSEPLTRLRIHHHYSCAALLLLLRHLLRHCRQSLLSGLELLSPPRSLICRLIASSHLVSYMNVWAK